MTDCHYKIRFDLLDAKQVAPEDIFDAIKTLSFEKKFIIDVNAPGMGPNALLSWALEELSEAENSTHTSPRKAFAATVLSKTAAECLIDWYLDSTHIGSTNIRSQAGTEEKLKYLDAESFLGIGLSLFRSILSEPRNRAIHSYSAIDLASARNAYELARLLIHSAINARPPNQCSIYYGNLDFDRLPFEDYHGHPLGSFKFFNFRGIGKPGDHGVVFIRGETPVIAVLESEGHNGVNLRAARLSEFKPDLLRSIISALESSKPTPHQLAPHETLILSEIFSFSGS